MQPETCGSHILMKVFAKTSLGEIYKALPLDGPAEIRLVHRLPEEVEKTPEAEKLVRRQAKQWQGVKDLHALNLLEMSKPGDPLWCAFEYHQGRLVSDILERSRQEGIPLAVDQSVYLAERLAGALLSLSTQGLTHGCMSPERMLVTFEGEVKVLPGVFRDLQTTPMVTSPALDAYRKYIPPDLAQGKGPKGYTDIYAVGAMLFEFLAHEPFFNGKPGFDAAARLEEAKKGEGSTDVLPASLYSILKKSLVSGGPDSYQDLSALKADLDQLITSGEYSPTTFNIAFLMHSLFRGEDETEAASDKELLTLDRAPFRPAPPPVAKPAPPAAPVSGKFPAVAAEEASTFGVEPEPSRKGLFIGIGVAAVVVLIAVLGYIAFRPKGPSQAEIQAQEELKKLQAQQTEMAQRMKSLEDEKNQLAQQVASAKTEDEKKKAQKALEEANKKLEASKADAAKLAASTAAVATAAKPTTTAPATPPPSTPPPTPSTTTPPSTPPTTTPAPPAATTAPSTSPPAAPEPAATTEAGPKIKAGDFVELWAVDIKPKQQGEMKIQVTPAGRQNHVAGTIYLEVAVDESGRVTDARVVRGLNPDYGMNDVCREAALKLKYSPAIKEGLPVKTKVTFPIVIK